MLSFLQRVISPALLAIRPVFGQHPPQRIPVGAPVRRPVLASPQSPHRSPHQSHRNQAGPWLVANLGAVGMGRRVGIQGVGLAAGLWAIASVMTPLSAHAYTARQEVFLARQSVEETYPTFLRRAEQAARAAAQRYFDRDLLVSEVAITIVGESQGSTIPILALHASRYQWRNRPDPRYWITHFATAKTLLGFEEPVTPPPAPAVEAPPTTAPAAAGPPASDRCSSPSDANDPNQALLADACALAEQLVGRDRFPSLVAGSSSSATTGLAASCQTNLANLPAFRSASPAPPAVSEVYEVLRGVYLVSPPLNTWVEATETTPVPPSFACVYRHSPDPRQGMGILVARPIPAEWQPTYSLQLRERQQQPSR